MTSTESKRNAQQARDDYRIARRERLAQREELLELDDPVLPGNPVIDPLDGTLNKDALTRDLPVNVSAWADLPPISGIVSELTLLWGKARSDGSPPADDEGYTVVDSRQVTGPPENITFPIALTVPKDDLAPDGRYYLRTRVAHYSSGNFIYSTPMALITDSEPPYRHAAPAAMTLPALPVTDQYLSDNGDKVIGTIAQYDDYQPGDKVAYYWGALPPPDLPEDATPVDVISVDGATWPLPVTFSGEVIRAAGDGGCYALYALIDKATNISRLSTYVRVPVALGPLPAGLQNPVVPLAVDGLLDLKDAIEGVVVEIPAFTGHKHSDSIKVSWGASQLLGQQVGTNPRFPLQVPVPAPILRSNYTSASGPQDTAVSYVVMRGDVASANKSTTISVDFSVVGPPLPDPDPDWPDLINPNLSVAEVRGESDLANELTRADENKDATLKFELYDPPAAGHLISFWWDGVEVVEAHYEVQSDDSAGKEITVTIPWRYILAGFNNPALPVWYEVGAVDAANRQKSPRTMVKANAVTPQPAKPVYQGLYNNQFLNCDSLYVDPSTPGALEPAIRVEVPDLSQAPYFLKDGDQVTLSWVLIGGYVGETPIADSELDQPVTLGATYPVTGFIWYVQPYAKHILPAYDPGGTGQDSRGRAHYSFEFQGETVISAKAEAYVAMHTGTGTCPIPPTTTN